MPEPQLVPLDLLVHALVEVDGSQLWHAFAGFVAFDAKKLPESQQPDVHDPESQMSAAAQLVPFATGG